MPLDEGGHQNGSMRRSLGALRVGSRATITEIPLGDPAVAAELAALRILPDEPVEVVEVLPFGGPLLIQTAGGVYALGRHLAERIVVRAEP